MNAHPRLQHFCVPGQLSSSLHRLFKWPGKQSTRAKLTKGHLPGFLTGAGFKQTNSHNLLQHFCFPGQLRSVLHFLGSFAGQNKAARLTGGHFPVLWRFPVFKKNIYCLCKHLTILGVTSCTFCYIEREAQFKTLFFSIRRLNKAKNAETISCLFHDLNITYLMILCVSVSTH